MNTNGKSQIPAILKKNEPELLAAWLAEQTRWRLSGKPHEGGRAAGAEPGVPAPVPGGGPEWRRPEGDGPEWQRVREMLAGLSRSRALQGFSPSETATFVFSLKKPLFERLRQRVRQGRRRARARRPGRPPRCSTSSGSSPPRSTRRPRGGDRPPAAGDAGALHAGGEAVGRHPGAAADRHAGQRAHPGGDGEPAAEDRRDGRGDRHHRHHRRADRGYAGGAAPAEDGGRGAADGRRVHHQRHPPADRRRPSSTWAWSWAT